MSNKPITKPGFHDASDPRCLNHENAKRLAMVRANESRSCPMCNPVTA